MYYNKYLRIISEEFYKQTNNKQDGMRTMTAGGRKTGKESD